MPLQLMGPMDCRTFRKNHLAYLDDTLSGDQTSAAQRHILACDPCAAHDTMVRRSLMVARSMPTIEPSAAFQERLQAKLAQCREERATQQALQHDFDVEMELDGALSPKVGVRSMWRTPRTYAAIAASAVIGTMVWRGFAPSQAPLIAMQPVIASQPATLDMPQISPLLLQAMATGNPVWPATVMLEEVPSQFVNVDYSMTFDGR